MVDVLVVGAGSAGSTAAIAAARTGASTLLVDRLGFLGGTSTAVLDTFYAFYTPGREPRKVVAGIPDEVVAGLEAEGAAFLRPNTYGAGTGITYDPETLKRVWESLVLDAGADVLLHSFVHGVELDGGTVAAVRLWTKGGERVIRPRVVVDASGDADVCHLAGAPYEAPGEGGQVQSLSTVFRMANVDTDRAEAVPKEELWALMREASASGDYALTRLEGSVHRTPQRGVMMALMTRMRDVDATDPEQLTRAEIEGRRQCREYFRFLRERVPGYEEAVLVSTSPAIGVRESRRILGEHVLTGDEILAATRFPDEIAQCGAPIEDHHARLRHPLGLSPRGRDLRDSRIGRCCRARSRTSSSPGAASRRRTTRMLRRAAWARAWRWARRRERLLRWRRRGDVAPRELDPASVAGAPAGGRCRCRRLSGSGRSGSSP